LDEGEDAMRKGTLSLERWSFAKRQNSVISKNAYNLAIFNCNWYHENRQVYSSVFTPSAVVTPNNFCIFH